MYETVKTIIEAGGYDLADLIQRINVLYARGQLTEEESAGLIELARERAEAADSYGPLEERVEALEVWQVEAKGQIEALQQGGEPEEPAEEWPEYVQPTGAHDAYRNGDKVTFQGERYVCTAPEGTACVWDPATYPAYWEKA